ncbi:hypothetical protein ACFIOY_26465 [Bradyrhizobium sp. TZ2]
MSFDYDRLNGFENLDAGETVQGQYSSDRIVCTWKFHHIANDQRQFRERFHRRRIEFFQSDPTGAGANSAIRFVSSAINGVNERVTIENLNIATTTTTTVPGTPGNNYETTYTEDGAAVAIALGPVVTDDGGTIAVARVVLTNASAGDQPSAAGLPGGITASVDNLYPARSL